MAKGMQKKRERPCPFLMRQQSGTVTNVNNKADAIAAGKEGRYFQR